MARRWVREVPTRRIRDLLVALVLFWSAASTYTGISGWWFAWGGTQVLALICAYAAGAMTVIAWLGNTGSVSLERREDDGA